MSKGIKTIIYPVTDMAQARELFKKLLEVEPYADQPYYTGFKVEDQDIGLVPNSPEEGVAAFFHVADIKKSLQILEDGGAKVIRKVMDVGNGRLVASARDASGNIIGLVQN